MSELAQSVLPEDTSARVLEATSSGAGCVSPPIRVVSAGHLPGARSSCSGGACYTCCLPVSIDTPVSAFLVGLVTPLAALALLRFRFARFSCCLVGLPAGFPAVPAAAELPAWPATATSALTGDVGFWAGFYALVGVLFRFLIGALCSAPVVPLNMPAALPLLGLAWLSHPPLHHGRCRRTVGAWLCLFTPLVGLMDEPGWWCLQWFTPTTPLPRVPPTPSFSGRPLTQWTRQQGAAWWLYYDRQRRGSRGVPSPSPAATDACCSGTYIDGQPPVGPRLFPLPLSLPVTDAFPVVHALLF